MWFLCLIHYPKRKKLVQYRPLPDALVRNLEDWFRVELTYTNNAIEVTHTRRDTALVVEKGIKPLAAKSLIEHLEAKKSD